MWSAQCSDPGIQSRDAKNTTALLSTNDGNEGFNFNESLLSLNDYEKELFDPRKDVDDGQLV